MAKFELNHIPFGLAQASACFQRFVNEILTGLEFAFRYLDVILDFSPDIRMHLKSLRILFQRLRMADHKLKESKHTIS